MATAATAPTATADAAAQVSLRRVGLTSRRMVRRAADDVFAQLAQRLTADQGGGLLVSDRCEAG